VGDAREVVRSLRPRVVFLELCRSRAGLLERPIHRTTGGAPPVDAQRFMEDLTQNGILSAVNLALSSYMEEIADNLGIEYTPGAEFIAANAEASQYFPFPQQGANPPQGYGKVQLGDRPIMVTLLRAMRALTVLDKVKLAWTFATEDIASITAEDLEALKDTDLLTEAIMEVGEWQPRLLEPLIYERDRYMRYKLQNTCRQLRTYLQQQSPQEQQMRDQLWGAGTATIVALVGLGHVKGIVEDWDKPYDAQDMERISEVPPEPLGDRMARRALLVTTVVAAIGTTYLVYRGVSTGVRLGIRFIPAVPLLYPRLSAST